ncbi:MAG TPA: beta-propeller domain-containing protein, partial [Pyrinomonadaceae bacterium]|nr:beta-propeller domain-containing protein [Pyrinomonadaceae bacterium]
MKTLFLLTLVFVASASLLLGATLLTTETIPPVGATSAAAPPKKKMKAFGSEREMERYFRQVAEREKRARQQNKANEELSATGLFSVYDAAAPVIESVTNTQHAGVDEGGLVKVHGDHLVILRRGRLFTVAIGDDDLRPISSIDAFGPAIGAVNAWYDEMLISGNTVVVIGYSYGRGGTEVNLFNIDAAGQLGYRSTYHLRSNDYFSSRNYASRLIGTKLIFYAPLDFLSGEEDPFASFPAVRKWHQGAKEEEFRRIVPFNRVYCPNGDLSKEDSLTLHTVTTCDLANGGFNCEATTVVGPSGRVFYVSPDSVYVWATSWFSDRRQSLLFRMPLDGSSPTALRVSGSPIDQFSFLQSDDEYLNVVVRADGKGDGMWSSQSADGDVSLMRVSLGRFSDGSEEVPSENYWRLPTPPGYNFQNRFVHNYLLYGAARSGNPYSTNGRENRVYLIDWRRSTTQRIVLPHGVERIEQMGADAVVVGSDGNDLHFTAIRLGPEAEIVSRYLRKEASQGETRSQGFFYKPDGNDSGTLGLPISTPMPAGYWNHQMKSSAAVLFLRNEARQFREVGELEAQSDKTV